MFTGIITDTSEIEDVREIGEGKRIKISSDIFTDCSEGDSISISGVCLTIEKLTDSTAVFFLSEETIQRTWFDGISTGDELNVERSLTPSETMDGHIVQGHVDATAEVIDLEELEQGWNLTFSKPEDLENYIVEKGFVAVEGISLTVTSEDEKSFSVTIIPETWERTNLSEKSSGSKVNIEADITAKYLEKIHA